jgi:hypothetical protein
MIVHNRELIDLHHSNIQNLERSKQDRITIQKTLATINKKVELLRDEVAVGENHTTKIESFVDFYLPVKI